MFELKKSNVHRIVKSETERDRLLAQGYVEVVPKAPKTTKAPKATKKTDGE